MIRHGESEANFGKYASGHKDVALTPRGLEQARAAALVVSALAIKPALIVHSHLQRAKITAEIINENLGIPMIEDPLIAEQMYGDWEGKPWDQTREPTRAGIDPPNGESHADFFTRVKDTITRQVENNASPIMFVCHGGVFRAVGALYGQAIHGVENCSLHHFHPDTDEAAIAFPWTIQKFA